MAEGKQRDTKLFFSSGGREQITSMINNYLPKNTSCGQKWPSQPSQPQQLPPLTAGGAPDCTELIKSISQLESARTLHDLPGGRGVTRKDVVLHYQLKFGFYIKN